MRWKLLFELQLKSSVLLGEVFVHPFLACVPLFELTHCLLGNLHCELFGLIIHIKLHLEETIILALLLKLFVLLSNDFFEIMDYLSGSCVFHFFLPLVRLPLFVEYTYRCFVFLELVLVLAKRHLFNVPALFLGWLLPHEFVAV